MKQSGRVLIVLLLSALINTLFAVIYNLAETAEVIPTSISTDSGYTMDVVFLNDGVSNNTEACQCCSSTDLEQRPGFTLALSENQTFRIARIDVVGLSNGTYEDSSLADLHVYQESRVGPMLTDPISIVTENVTSVTLYLKDVLWDEVLTLQIEGRQSKLAICELMVYSSDIVSLNKNVTMSSTRESPAGVFWSADKAVQEGMVLTSAVCQCCAATQIMPNPWLKVDLGEEVAIGYVDVVCLDDDLPPRLKDVELHLEENPISTPEHVFDGSTCYYYITIKQVVRSQYVTLLRPRQDSMSLSVCDIKIYHKVCPPGKYGNACEKSCGYCNSTDCDVISGECSACEDGTGTYPLCRYYSLSLTSASLGSDTNSHNISITVTATGSNWLQMTFTETTWLKAINISTCTVDVDLYFTPYTSHVGEDAVVINITDNFCLFSLTDAQFSTYITLISRSGASLVGSDVDMLVIPECTKPGHYGPECVPCSMNCVPGTCDNIRGHCTCQPGFRSDGCSLNCRFGTYGKDCSSTCRCLNGYPCDHITGQCPLGKCSSGYMGPQCNQPCPQGMFGPDCSLSCPPGDIVIPWIIGVVSCVSSGALTLGVLLILRNRNKIVSENDEQSEDESQPPTDDNDFQSTSKDVSDNAVRNNVLSPSIRSERASTSKDVSDSAGRNYVVSPSIRSEVASTSRYGNPHSEDRASVKSAAMSDNISANMSDMPPTRGSVKKSGTGVRAEYDVRSQRSYNSAADVNEQRSQSSTLGSPTTSVTHQYLSVDGRSRKSLFQSPDGQRRKHSDYLLVTSGHAVSRSRIEHLDISPSPSTSRAVPRQRLSDRSFTSTRDGRNW